MTQEKYHIVFGVDFEEKEGVEEAQFKHAHAFSIMLVKNFIETYLTRGAVTLYPLRTGSRIDSDLFQKDVIILGWKQGIVGFDDFLDSLQTPHYYDSHDRLVKRSGASESRKPKSGDNGIVESDFGSLIRIVHPKTGKLIILFDAHYGLGILGLSKLMTTLIKQPNPNSSLLKSIVNEVNSSREGCHLIIEVHNYGKKSILDSDSISYSLSGCAHFRVEESKLTEAIASATTIQKKDTSLESDFMNS